MSSRLGRLPVALLAAVALGCAGQPVPTSDVPTSAGTSAAATAPSVGQASESAVPFEPRFVEVDCPAEVTMVIVLEVHCGRLAVLEDRSKIEGGTIELFVLRIEPPGGATSPDPMIAVGGTLGESVGYGGLGSTGQRVGRTLFILDARGTGLSTPKLDCPEVVEADVPMAAFGSASAEAKDLLRGAVGVCHDRMIQQGIDLAAYDLVEASADVEDLRVALGIETWESHRGRFVLSLGGRGSASLSRTLAVGRFRLAAAPSE